MFRFVDVFYPEEGAGGCHGEGNLLTHSMSAAHQDVLRYLAPKLAQVGRGKNPWEMGPPLVKGRGQPIRKRGW